MIVETRATASHRYYMNKKKDDIVWRIRSMRRQLLSMGIHTEFFPKAVIEDIDQNCNVPGWLKREHTREQLASMAMHLHGLFPEDTDNG